MMRILFIGDIFGRPGRLAVRRLLPPLIAEKGIDLVVANVENLVNGRGIEEKRLKELFDAGVDVGTGGNHIWQVKGTDDLLDRDPRLVRPLNLPEPCPGRGVTLVTTRSGIPVAVLNLLGRIFMEPADCPFRAADRALAALPSDVKIRLVDFHAEATSEKIALAGHLDGRVTLLAGTHTHVQTADERVSPAGTAYITDAGMTGPHDSIIGMDKTNVIARFLTGRPALFTPADGDARLHGVLLEADPADGRAFSIERIARSAGDG